MHPLLANLFSDTWAMEPGALELFLDVLARADWKSAAMIDAAPAPLAFERKGSVAVIPVSGVLLPRVPEIFRAFGVDATGYDEIASAVKTAAADPSVARIVLSVDSHGGSVSGVHAAADAIHAARDMKPITAEVGGMAASAAYWLASQSSNISADRGAMIGSIGVYGVIRDMSAAADKAGIKVHVIASHPLKGAGVPGAPVSDAQLADQQRVIDTMANQFVADVARGLGKSTKDVSTMATGQIWSAQEAHASGLIHAVQSAQDFTHMDAFALIEKHPKHAALIASMAKSGKPIAEMESAIERADATEAHAALIAERDALKASVELQTKCAKENGELAVAEKARADKAVADLAALKAHVDGGKPAAKVKPDGDDKAETKTKDELEAMAPKERAAFFAAGGVLV